MKDLTFVWDGVHECFRPTPRFRKFCNATFVDEEMYTVDIREERSGPSHRHLFAVVKEAWMNLPDELALEFATPEHLRKRALIETGHYDERRFACTDAVAARNLVRFLKPIDEYAVYAISENVVIERRPKSIATKAMNKKAFQQAKDDVITYCEKLIGVKPGEITESA